MSNIPPFIQAIFAEADRRWPHRSHASDGAMGDPRHQALGGDHTIQARGYVHAADVTHDPAHGFDAWYWANKIAARCKTGTERRIKYLVSYDPIQRHDVVASPNSGWNWRLNNNPNDGSQAHASHLHISILSEPFAEQSTAPIFVAVITKPKPPRGGDPMEHIMQPGRTKNPTRPACATLDIEADCLVLWNGASVRGDVSTPYGFRVWKIPSEVAALSFREVKGGIELLDVRGFGYNAVWS